MKKWIISFSCLMIGFIFPSSAQSIQQASWKSYFGDPINDTITLIFGMDTMWAKNTKGDTLAISSINVSGDTITLNDVSTGDYSCPDQTGIYTFTIKDGILYFALVSDACNGRQQITNLKWAKLPENS